MKLKFSKLIPNEEAKAIIETYEKEGYVFRFPECRPEDYQMEEGTEHLTLLASTCAPNMTPVYLPKEWFKKKEPLEVGVWYNREDFDANPKGHGLIERTEDGDLWMHTGDNAKSLLSYSTSFMYFELPEKEES